MSLFSLLLVAAVILLCVSALATVGQWIVWVALGCAVVAALVAVTNNDRALR